MPRAATNAPRRTAPWPRVRARRRRRVHVRATAVEVHDNAPTPRRRPGAQPLHLQRRPVAAPRPRLRAAATLPPSSTSLRQARVQPLRPGAATSPRRSGVAAEPPTTGTTSTSPHDSVRLRAVRNGTMAATASPSSAQHPSPQRHLAASPMTAAPPALTFCSRRATEEPPRRRSTTLLVPAAASCHDTAAELCVHLSPSPEALNGEPVPRRRDLPALDPYLHRASNRRQAYW